MHGATRPPCVDRELVESLVCRRSGVAPFFPRVGGDVQRSLPKIRIGGQEDGLTAISVGGNRYERYHASEVGSETSVTQAARADHKYGKAS